MLLRFFKSYSPVWRQAQGLYALAVRAARNPVFYRDHHVPDTLDGRFEMITLFVYAQIHRADPALAQAIFDVMFQDMDHSLREMGVGDLSVPRKIKAMMTAFNGRIHAYRAALAPDAGVGDLASAIRRNVYGTVPVAADDDVAFVAQALYDVLKGGDHAQTTAA